MDLFLLETQADVSFGLSLHLACVEISVVVTLALVFSYQNTEITSDILHLAVPLFVPYHAHAGPQTDTFTTPFTSYFKPPKADWARIDFGYFLGPLPLSKSSAAR